MSDVVTEDAKPTALGNAAVFCGVVARPTRGGRHAQRYSSQPARRRPATAGSVAGRDGARSFLPAATWDTVQEGVTQRRALVIGAGRVGISSRRRNATRGSRSTSSQGRPAPAPSRRLRPLPPWRSISSCAAGPSDPCSRSPICVTAGRSDPVRARTRCREVGGRAAPARFSRAAVAMGGGSGPYADAERQGAVEGISAGSESHAQRGTRRRLAARGRRRAAAARAGAGALRTRRADRAARPSRVRRHGRCRGAWRGRAAPPGEFAAGNWEDGRGPQRITVSERGRSEPERRHAPKGGRAARSRPRMGCDARMAPD